MSLNKKKLELEIQRQNLVEGIVLRSHANWHESGERCTEIFCKLEKKAFINKTMIEIISDDDICVSDQKKYYLNTILQKII